MQGDAQPASIDASTLAQNQKVLPLHSGPAGKRTSKLASVEYWSGDSTPCSNSTIPSFNCADIHTVCVRPKARRRLQWSGTTVLYASAGGMTQ